MSNTVNPIPEEYKGATPYLCLNDAAAAIEFYKNVFGAVETIRMPMPDGKVAHAELKIGGAPIMLADEFPDMGFRGPHALGGSPVTLHLYVEDVDTVVEQATTAGAKVLSEVKDQFYGDRAGKIEDPFGHIWYIATHKEDVTPEEMKRRSDAMFAQSPAETEAA